MSMEPQNAPWEIDWGVATLALPGEAESGDRYLIQRIPNGILLAAVDGLGHGAAAAVAAATAIDLLEHHAHESLLALVNRCHQGLLETRGVVMSLAALHSSDETI